MEFTDDTFADVCGQGKSGYGKTNTEHELSQDLLNKVKVFGEEDEAKTQALNSEKSNASWLLHDSFFKNCACDRDFFCLFVWP